MPSIKKLIHEIHQRSLWQVLLVYAGASWAVFAGVQTLTEGLGLPAWFPASALTLLLVGLPIVLATAFVQRGLLPARGHDPTLLPGAEQTADARPEAMAGAHKLFTWRNAISGGVLALALWGVVATGWYLIYGSSPSPRSGDRKSVAVIPFVNVSADGEEDYFSDGVTFEIINSLSRISDLKVISRTSVMQYKGTTKNIRQIGEELDVAAVVEGEVQRAENRVRINVKLIDAVTDDHLWAETYDRDYGDVLGVQAELARDIASVLEAELTPQEVEGIEAEPTDNPEAYEAYLRGNEYLNRSNQGSDLRIAVRMFSEAVGLDPEFAAAYARLSLTHSRIYWFGYDHTEERLTRANDAAQKSLQLEPDLPDAHLALGTFYYYGRRDYEAALAEFSTALQLQPNNSDVLATMAYVQRRRGEWELARINLLKAFELDPRSPVKAEQVAITDMFMRNFGEAERYIDLAISLSPESTQLYSVKAELVLAASGDARAALRAIEGAPEMNVAEMSSDNARWLWRLFFIAGNYTRPLQELNPRTLNDDTTLYFLTKGELYDLLGQPEESRAYYDSARVAIESRLRLTGPGTAAFNLHCQLGTAYAALGRKDDALREGAACVEVLPLSKDAMMGNYNLRRRARIYAMVGEPDSAISQLEYLLSIPSYQVTGARLRVDPHWDPLRSHPGFQELLGEYGE